MAELSDERKDTISHRGHAARALHAWLDRLTARPLPGPSVRPALTAG